MVLQTKRLFLRELNIDDANYFYLIRSGLISIEVHVPNKGPQVIQTLRKGDIAGWSWIFPPYKWNFDLKVIEPVSAVALDGKCLREKCEADQSLGYLLMKKFAKIMTDRLKATRMQLHTAKNSPFFTCFAAFILHQDSEC